MGLKTKILTISNVNWWIGSDKYLTLPNWLYDSEWVDIGRGKRTILSTNTTNNVVSIPNSSKVTVLWPTYYASDNWYIYDTTWATLYKYVSSSPNNYDVRNYITHTISGTSYTLFFGRNKIMRYIAESAVSLSWSWSNWTNASWTYTHTTGNTSVFTGTGTVATSSYYRLKVTIASRTAWTVDVAVWWATPQTLSANGTYYLFFSTSSTANLTFTPTSTFDGSVNTTTLVLGKQNVTETYLTMATTSYVCPLLSENGNIYVGNSNRLQGIDSLGTIITYFTLPTGEEIRWLTKVGDQYVLWVDDWQGTKQYFWDGLADAPLRVIYWYNERVMNVVNQWTYHIVTTGNDFAIKKIWKSDGYNKVMLYQIPYTSFSITSNKLLPPVPLYYAGNSNLVYQNAIESLWEQTFLPAYWGILSYGKKTAGFPDAINFEWDIVTDEIYAMYAYNDNLYVSYNSSGTCYVTQIKLENYENTLDSTDDYYFGKIGHITYPPFVYVVAQEKSSQKIKAGYNIPTTNTFLSVYYALDREVNYYTFVVDESVNNITTLPIVWAVYRTGTNSRFTVSKVTTQGNYTFIECTETTKEFTPRTATALTKVSGTGDSTITYIKFNNFRHHWLITDNTNRKYTSMIKQNFTEIQFRVELVTQDWKYSPEINDFTFVYDEITND